MKDFFNSETLVLSFTEAENLSKSNNVADTERQPTTSHE